MTDSDAHALERLLQDAEFRARFRRDPAAAARQAGLRELADEFELGDPMQTLEPRESRSSLAGVLLAGVLEGAGIYEGGQHLLPPVEDAYAANAPQQGGAGWAFVRAGGSFPGNHPDYVQLRGYGASGVLWDPDDPAAAAGIASSHGAGLTAGIWLVPHQNESPQAFAERAADAIGRYHPDKVVLDIEAIGKGYAGSPGWQWSDEMMNAFSHLQPNPPPLAVTVEPLQDDFNYAAYTSRGAEVWPQSYLGDMTPRDPQQVVDRVVTNGVPRNLVIPVLGPNQLDGYNGPHNVYTADDIQGRTPHPTASPPAAVPDSAHAGTTPPPAVPEPPNAGTSPPAAATDSPKAGGFRPALTPDQIAADRVARDAVRAAESPSGPAAPTAGAPSSDAVPSPLSGAVQSNLDPDDLQGNLDDEDAGADEEDGSNEDEADEGGSDDGDDEGSDDASDDEGESDDDQDAPGEGSNGEDANDPSSDGDSSDDSDSSAGDGSSDSSGDSSPDDGATPDLQAVDSAYPGDKAPREQVAAWMASAAQKRGLPPELPVMAALTESGLSNLDHGDADSVGFFQMRVSIWNQGAYSGYPDKPERQLDWFLDHAEAVKKQRLARGLAVDNPKNYGEWIADVENPAAQYRGRYQEHFAEARELLAQKAAKQSNGDQLAQVVDGAELKAGPRALTALAEAKKFLGTPYLWGGSTPKTGFDCSGLVQWAYARAGIHIPRVTDDQILAPGATAVSRRNLLPGDLVFFRDSTGYVHHVGISLGGDRFIHAPHTGDVVKVSSLKDSYYAREFTGGRRFDAAGTSAASNHEAAHASAAKATLAAEQRAQAEAVRIAQAALDSDAAAVQNPNTALFRALVRQEAGKGGPGK
jgi:cell wall-associated NlpC family hydrolase